MSFSQISAAALTAWAALISAISTPFIALAVIVNGRIAKRDRKEIKSVVEEVKGTVGAVKEHTDGMLKTMMDSAKKAGHEAGVEQATAVAEVKADALAKGQAEGREQEQQQTKKLPDGSKK